MIALNTARLGCCVLSLVLVTSPLAAQTIPAMDSSRLKEMLLNVPTGSPLTVKTTDGTELSGKLLGLTNDGFEVQAVVDDSIETRTLAFSEVASLDPGPRRSLFAKLLNPVMSVLTVVGAVAAVTAAFK